jgi:hypothetical protein
MVAPSPWPTTHGAVETKCLIYARGLGLGLLGCGCREGPVKNWASSYGLTAHGI